MEAIASYDAILSPSFCRSFCRIRLGLKGDEPIPLTMARDPHLSPTHGDLRVLVSANTKVVLITGTWDCLHPDIEVFLKKAEEADVDLHYIEGKEMIHDWPIVLPSLVPEAEEGRGKIVAAVLKNSTF